MDTYDSDDSINYVEREIQNRMDIKEDTHIFQLNNTIRSI
jgi:hypothetical protein